MPKSKWRPTKCKYCPATVETGAVISKRGLCIECGHQRQAAAVKELAEKNGEVYLHWLENPGGDAGHPKRRGVGGRFESAGRGDD